MTGREIGSADPRTPGAEAIRAHFAAAHQEHVFRFWGELGLEPRERLIRQAARIDLETLAAVHRTWSASEAAPPQALEPLPVERDPAHGGDPERFERAAGHGEELLGAGRVAALVVAGGQATRLGYPGPKGAFPLGPVTDRTLFAQQAQKIRRLRERTGRPVPWYVMTSDATDAETRELFEKEEHFGLPAEDVVPFCQGMVPSIDFEGGLLLERPDRIFENPDGHGGVVLALAASGALDDMAARGIDTLFYYQVDNPLVRIADPAFLGFHALAGAEMSCKVVAKVDPGEKVGVLARAGGRVCVVEYTEISDAHRNERDADGELVYWAGNTAIHAFDTAFLSRVAAEADRVLPFHASAKKIPALDAKGNPTAPEEPNGLKLERFVFDALPEARDVCVVETRRDIEYSPVKNAEGSDSPATARRDLVARYRAWLDEAGIPLPPEGTSIEIDQSVIDGPEDFRRLGIRSIEEARDAVCTAPGGVA